MVRMKVWVRCAMTLLVLGSPALANAHQTKGIPTVILSGDDPKIYTGG